MKARKIFVLALAVGLIFTFSNAVLGDGVEPPGDKCKVEIDERALITGDYSASKYKDGNDWKCAIIAKLKLTRKNGFETAVQKTIILDEPISDKNICTYSLKQLKEQVKQKIGAEKILSFFGIKISGTTPPRLTIVGLPKPRKESCDNNQLATIHGTVTMRVKLPEN